MEISCILGIHMLWYIMKLQVNPRVHEKLNVNLPEVRQTTA